ncbi:glycosyltransferase family 4 protein [Flavihumibacter sp. R14]|nr:glycosyltransferase family 4 protein [Flavihumibacter soli]
MNLIFLGGFFPKQFSDIILRKSRRQVQNSANKFQWAFIKGLEENLGSPIQLITAPFIGWFPKYYSDIFLRTASFSNNQEGGGGVMVGFLNLPIIKNLFKYLGLKLHLKKLISSQEKTVIIVYSLDTAYLKAALDSKKNNPLIKICVIIPDLHEFPGDSSLIYKLYLRYFEKPAFYKLLSKIDCFIVLSDKMVDYLKIQEKPWVRIEGLYDTLSNVVRKEVQPGNVKIVLYTGTLDLKYGIKHLLDAFNLIKSTDYRLWICGGGVGADLVSQRALKDSRIKYFGIVDANKVSELQARASLLINPRNNEGEYNIYSFPSKTMEYLASGTPTLMYRLAGIPEEYFDFCYTIDSKGIIGMAESITTVCDLPPASLIDKGKMAREFILQNKNSGKQCAKAIEMLENLAY